MTANQYPPNGQPQQQQYGQAPQVTVSGVNIPQGYVPQPSGFKTAGGFGQRWDANINWWDAPANQFSRIRFLGPVFIIKQHWLRSKNNKNFPMMCRNWDAAHQQTKPEEQQDCPICRDFASDKEMATRETALVHAIIRDLGVVKPVRINTTVRIALERLAQINVHQFTDPQSGKPITMAVDITDPYYGMDVFYLFSPNDKSTKHQISQAASCSLSPQELEYLNQLTNWRDIIKPEPAAEVVRSLKMNGYYGEEPAAVVHAPQAGGYQAGPSVQTQVLAAPPLPGGPGIVPAGYASAPAPYTPPQSQAAPAPYAPPQAPQAPYAPPQAAPQAQAYVPPQAAPQAPYAPPAYAPQAAPYTPPQAQAYAPPAPVSAPAPYALPAPVPAPQAQQVSSPVPFAPPPLPSQLGGVNSYQPPFSGNAVPSPQEVFSAPEPQAPLPPNVPSPLALVPQPAPSPQVSAAAPGERTFTLPGRGSGNVDFFNGEVQKHATQVARANPLKVAESGELAGLTVHKCFAGYVGDGSCIRCPVRKQCLDTKPA